MKNYDIILDSINFFFEFANCSTVAVQTAVEVWQTL